MSPEGKTEGRRGDYIKTHPPTWSAGDRAQSNI